MSGLELRNRLGSTRGGISPGSEKADLYRAHRVCNWVWLGALLASPVAHAVIILPENVDWSKPNWREPIQVQETAPAVMAPQSNGPKLVITLRKPERLPTDAIRLADIADIECADKLLREEISGIELVETPDPGETATVFPSRIERAIRGLGFSQGDFVIQGPDRILIQAESQTVSMDMIEDAINLALEMESNEGTTVEAFLVNKPTPIHLPPGELDIVPLELDRPGSGIRQVQLAYLVDGRKADTHTYSVRVNEKRETLVASRDFAAGDYIASRDLEKGFVVVRPHADVDEWIEDADFLEGAVAKRGIHAGDPISLADIEWEPILSKGSPVTLKQRAGKVEVQKQGILLEDVIRIGQEVRVRLPNDRKTFVGIAVSGSVVEIY